MSTITTRRRVRRQADRLACVREQIRQGARAPHEFVALGHILHDLRLYKTRAELRVMRKAAKIASEAHLARAMRATRAGLNEHEIEAELLHTFHRHGAVVPSYEPIVGGGANGCVLHYRANNATLKDGDLLLVDAGAEYHCYASDITRTYPVNGKFRWRSARLRHRPCRAARAVDAEVRAGRPFIAYHDAAVRVITAGLFKLGLLKGSVDRTSATVRSSVSTCTRPATSEPTTAATSATTAMSTANTASSSRAWS